MTVLKGVDRVQRGTLKLHANGGQFLESRTVNLAPTPAHRDASLTLPVGRDQGKKFSRLARGARQLFGWFRRSKTRAICRLAFRKTSHAASAPIRGAPRSSGAQSHFCTRSRSRAAPPGVVRSRASGTDRTPVRASRCSFRSLIPRGITPPRPLPRARRPSRSRRTCPPFRLCNPRT